MEEVSARKILDKLVQPDGSLMETEHNWIVWPVSPDGGTIDLDGGFTSEQLEAVAWWIRNTPVPKCPKPTGYWFKSP